MKYKVGDVVRIKATNEEGKVIQVSKKHNYIEVKLSNDYVDWFREAELCDPAPVKVGDVLVNGGLEAKVLEVFENTFAKSLWNAFTRMGGIYTFDDIKKDGWKVKGKEETPEVIEIGGKKYLKKDVEERVKELDEVK